MAHSITNNDTYFPHGRNGSNFYWGRYCCTQYFSEYTREGKWGGLRGGYPSAEESNQSRIERAAKSESPHTPAEGGAEERRWATKCQEVK
jgi:hypothetical protein